MEINHKIFIYAVGKYCDSNLEKIPNSERKHDFILYIRPEVENERVISSLEGYFLSESDLSFVYNSSNKNFLFNKENISWLERFFSGKLYLNK